MFYFLSHKPYENMAVKHHIFKLEILLVFVLVDESGFKFSFLSHVEFFYLDLLGKHDSVL